MIRVEMPSWWTEVPEVVYGYTNGLVTYACSSEPVYYVEVPEFEYEGYFSVRELKVVKGGI
jgi:hypothetical protein